MGIIDRRVRERQRRIDEIVDAARRIFGVKGYSNTTMNDIADTSELSRRTVYLYFKNKEQLSLAVIAQTLSTVADRFEDIISTPDPALDRIARMFDVYRSLLAEDSGSFQFLANFAETAKAVDEDDESRVACDRALARIEKSVAQVLRLGREDGVLRFSDDVDELAGAVIFMVHSVAASARSYEGLFSSRSDASLQLSFSSVIEKTFHILTSYFVVDTTRF